MTAAFFCEQRATKDLHQSADYSKEDENSKIINFVLK